jgi:adenosylhomocysteine nucleosidase
MNFVVALKAEAGPLIERFKLTKESTPSPFPVFANDNLRLVLSGVGKELSAKATTYLSERFPQPNQAWLNFGLAGHGNLGLGTAFLANRILDDGGENAFYPTQLLDHDLESSALQTCSSPVSDYPDPIGYDMEGSAFCASASLGSIRELIQVIKIVSDNPEHPVGSFDRSSVGTLIEGALSSILPLVDQLEELAHKIKPALGLAELIDSVLSLHPFSETQRHQVRKLLTHAQALGFPGKDALKGITGAKSAKQAISELRKSMEQHRVLP